MNVFIPTQSIPAFLSLSSLNKTLSSSTSAIFQSIHLSLLLSLSAFFPFPWSSLYLSISELLSHVSLFVLISLLFLSLILSPLNTQSLAHTHTTRTCMQSHTVFSLSVSVSLSHTHSQPPHQHPHSSAVCIPPGCGSAVGAERFILAACSAPASQIQAHPTWSFFIWGC